MVCHPPFGECPGLIVGNRRRRVFAADVDNVAEALAVLELKTLLTGSRFLEQWSSRTPPKISASTDSTNQCVAF
jgi:hypothetical protein